MIAVVLQAIWNLSRTALKTRLLAIIGALAVVANAAGLNVLLVLFGAGIATTVAKGAATRTKTISLRSVTRPLVGSISGATGIVADGVPFGLVPLFLFFLKVGATLFGSGYVLLAFLRSDLVVRLHWLSDKQLLDAIAIGQVTPGPVFTTATFVGYLLGRIPGSVVATIAIFLPAFVFIAIIGPLSPGCKIPNDRRLPRWSECWRAGSDGGGYLEFWQSRPGRRDPVGLAVLSAIAIIRFKINSTWLIFAGGLVGYLGHRFLS